VSPSVTPMTLPVKDSAPMATGPARSNAAPSEALRHANAERETEATGLRNSPLRCDAALTRRRPPVETSRRRAAGS
jgi:hypothetical protein